MHRPDDKNGIYIPKTLNVGINIDGIPLAKSFPACFWPILVFFKDLKGLQPLLIGCYYGKSKPESASDFLAEFISEITYVNSNFYKGTNIIKTLMGALRLGSSVTVVGRLKLRNVDILCLNNKLEEIRKCMPTEFLRPAREITYYKVWKGSEFNNFLNYIGIVALQNIICESVYNNILLLHVASTICQSVIHSRYLDHGNILI